MSEFASLIYPRGGAARYSTYISSSLGRRVKLEFYTRSSLAEIKRVVDKDKVTFELVKKETLSRESAD